MQIHVRKIMPHNLFIVITYFLATIICYFMISQENRVTYLFYMSLLTIALGIITISDIIKEEKLSIFLLMFGLLVLGSVMAFRAQTGTDDYIYKNYFFDVEEHTFFSFLLESNLEIGYSVINYILFHLTGGNYDVAQVILTYISFGLWGSAFCKNKNYGSLPVLALLLWTQFYFFVMRAGLIRIFIAIPIIFWALHFIWERQWKKFIICVLIASLFHVSALIMLVMLLLAVRKEWLFRNWGYFIVLLTLLIPISFLLISTLLVPILGNRYMEYASIGSFSISIGNFDVLPIWLLGLYYYRYIKDESERQRYIVGMILISMSMIFSVFSSLVSFGRLIYYSNLGILVIISGICRKKAETVIDYGMNCMVIIYAFFYMMYTIFLNEYSLDNIFPYISFWGII